ETGEADGAEVVDVGRAEAATDAPGQAEVTRDVEHEAGVEGQIVEGGLEGRDGRLAACVQRVVVGRLPIAEAAVAQAEGGRQTLGDEPRGVLHEETERAVA